MSHALLWVTTSLKNENPLSVMAGILFVLAFAPYFWAIYRDRNDPTVSKPSKVSWLIWAMLDSTALAGMLVRHCVNGQTVGAVMGAWTTVALLVKYGGQSDWTPAQKIYLAYGVMGAALSVLLKNADLAILVSVSAVFVGGFDTFRAAWKDPESENKWAWLVWWLSCVCADLAIPHATIADMAQPIVFTTIETTMVLILFVKPHFTLGTFPLPPR